MECWNFGENRYLKSRVGDNVQLCFADHMDSLDDSIICLWQSSPTTVCVCVDSLDDSIICLIFFVFTKGF